MFALVRRLAQVAGIPAAEQISPHRLRHSTPAATATAARSTAHPRTASVLYAG